MVAYVVLANFTEQGIRNAKESPKRAEAFKAMAKTFGVKVREIVWTQGRYDIVTILDAPDETSFMALTLSLCALGNVRTESLRAFSAAEMTQAVDGTTDGMRDEMPFIPLAAESLARRAQPSAQPSVVVAALDRVRPRESDRSDKPGLGHIVGFGRARRLELSIVVVEILERPMREGHDVGRTRRHREIGVEKHVWQPPTQVLRGRHTRRGGLGDERVIGE